jgi:hypothetical protein
MGDIMEQPDMDTLMGEDAIMANFFDCDILTDMAADVVDVAGDWVVLPVPDSVPAPAPDPTSPPLLESAMASIFSPAPLPSSPSLYDATIEVSDYSDETKSFKSFSEPPGGEDLDGSMVPGAYEWDASLTFPAKWTKYVRSSIEDKTASSPQARLALTAEAVRSLKACSPSMDRMLSDRITIRRRLTRFTTKDRAKFEELYFFAEKMYWLLTDENMALTMIKHENLFSGLGEKKEIPDALQKLCALEYAPEVTLDNRVGTLEQDMQNMRMTVEDLSSRISDEDDTRHRKALRMGDLAAYRSIRPSALCGDRDRDRDWCSPGRVVGVYSDGAGPLVVNDEPLNYMVVTAAPTMIEESQYGVPIEDQIRVVQVLHDLFFYF